MVADAVEAAGVGTVDAVRAAGGEASFVAVDVSVAEQAEAMVEHANATYGALHVLYNNAGILPDEDAGVVDTPEATWDRVLDVNLKGVFFGCRYGVPALLASGGGSIVNVSSVVALVGSAVPQIAYTASKGGVLALTRELAVQYAREGIRANAAVSGPDRDAADERAAPRPRVGAAAAGPHPDGPARSGRGAGSRGAVPRQ